MTISRRTLMGAAVVAATVVGSILPAAPASAAQARGVTSVRVTDSQHVRMPSSLRPGYASLHVSSRSFDGVLFVRKKQRGLTTLLHYMNQNSAAAAAKRQRIFDFVAYGGPGSRSRVYLRRGTYYVFDANAPRLNRSTVRTITVSGIRIDAPAPAATTIVQNRARAIPPSIELRHRYLRMVDQSSTNFFTLFVAGLPASVTPQRAGDVVAAPTLAKLSKILGPDHVARVVPVEVGPGHSAATSMAGFAKGRYLMYTGYGARQKQLRRGDVGVLTIR